MAVTVGADDRDMVNPVKSGGMVTEHATGVLVVGSLVLLFLIRRGFRGVSVGGVGVSIS